MSILLIILTAAAPCLCIVLFAWMLIRLNRSQPASRVEHIHGILRGEGDRIRQSAEDGARGLRAEMADGFRGQQDSTMKAFRELGNALSVSIHESADRLDAGTKAIEERTAATGNKLALDVERLNGAAVQDRDALRRLFEIKLDEATTKQANGAKGLRDELGGGFERLGTSIAESLNSAAGRQHDGLQQVSATLATFTEKQERSHEMLRQIVESRLDALRNENSSKLEEMRRTVDERLQSTLEARLGESFNRVVEQLERVHKGIGEMQTLATGVGDLKKVLSNVRARGAFGEVQLGVLLEQFLSPDQYARNVQVKENTQERVEFAIRLPGRDDLEVLLPVDAKFPLDDYERLVEALQAGDPARVSVATVALETRVRVFAKMISDKYIAPPQTTDFAILFLPTESLYAEVLRAPGLLESLQREFHVTLAGPTTFAALLNGLHMGFRSLAIERRTSEVWQILGAVRSEFGKYNEVVTRLARQLNTAAKSVEALGVRTRAMDRKLGVIEKLPASATPLLLGSDNDAIVADDEDDAAVPATETSTVG